MGSTNEDRQRRLVMIVEERNRASVNQLSAELGVSKETVRRDLAWLDRKGLIQKTHGGAASAHSAAETSFLKRSERQLREKQVIARLVNDLLSPGETLMMNAGTTVYAVANAISARNDLTVVTNSLDVGSRLLHARGGNSIVVLGGSLGQDSQTFGEMTLAEIRGFRVDHAILTVGAIDGESIYVDFSPEIASVVRAMMGQAKLTTIVADSSKFGKTALVEVCKLSAVHRVVTDTMPDSAISTAFRRENVELICPT
ncbi:DeoR/GlpR family DNA-binding transcription regulator [Bosea sp. 685]|uniref:DeoR/GlpR family DNA-binding transcription regulator n=1 Tax=Bosea sp. 685 TaxID=3080057 RepID=UPI0028932135|nr:DeoR/GlpR family DNA-binding transcription regulator [Bosea sp. 685]WNJ89839.1 DeoR/GlpR family DNA-binding transcription regulator [Bosea sp. 685]